MKFEDYAVSEIVNAIISGIFIIILTIWAIGAFAAAGAIAGAGIHWVGIPIATAPAFFLLGMWSNRK